MPRPLALLAAILTSGLLGCGGGGGSEGVSSLTISAPSAVVAPGGTLAFTAFVRGGGTVAWSADGGTISPSGVFTAPTAQGPVVVTASAGGKTATRTVTVTNGIAIALASTATPPLTIPLSKLAFAATVTGASDTTVRWTVTDAAGAQAFGAVATDGTFTAPRTPGTYTVVGAAQADATKTVTFLVQVVASVSVRFHWLDATKSVDRGDLDLALRPDVAPYTAANFVTLVNKGFYDGIVLHRKTTFLNDGIGVVQWGDPLTKTLPLSDARIGTGGPGYTIPYEETGLSNVAYSLAMARSSSLDSGGSQVFVNLLDDSATLDPQKYAVFGSVAPGSTAVADALVVGDVVGTARTVAASASASLRVGAR